MFLLAKYAEYCKGHGSLEVVDVNTILRAFDPTQYDKKKLYYIKCTSARTAKCKAIILFVTKTRKEALKKMTEERIKYPPLSKVAHPTSSDSDLPLPVEKASGKRIATKRTVVSLPKEHSKLLSKKLARMHSDSESVADESSEGEDSSQTLDLMHLSVKKNHTPKQSLTQENRSAPRESTSKQDYIQRLQDELFECKELLKEKDEQIQNLSRRNEGLQDKMLSRLDDMDKSIEDIEKAKANANSKTTLTKIGVLKKDSKSDDYLIHIGENVLLKKKQWDIVSLQAATPKLFVKGLARAAFGLKTLLGSKVCGKVSNRIRKANPNVRPRLNPQIIRAIQEGFKYWASRCSPPFDSVIVDSIARGTPTILSSFITQLRAKHCKQTFVDVDFGDNEEQILRKDSDEDEQILRKDSDEDEEQILRKDSDEDEDQILRKDSDEHEEQTCDETVQEKPTTGNNELMELTIDDDIPDDA